MRALRRGLGAGLAALALFLAWALWPEGPDFDPAPYLARAADFDVRILRDDWGVPHVYGAMDPDVAFGLAYAHSEDDFATIQKVLLATRGRLASVEGPSAAPMDYVVQLLGFWKDVDARYETDLSPETRALAEAYADGVNLWAAEHPHEVARGLVPVRGQDVVAGFAFKTPLFYGLDRTLLELFGDERRREVALAPTADAFRLVAGPQAALGSNAVAVAPSRSADGATRLLVNSHQPYSGPVAWYEVRLHSDTGWDMTGGVFPGSPIVLHGHGRNLGWASTVNRPDLVDVYVLDVDPDDPDRYRLDGEWKRLDVAEAAIDVKLLGRFHWTVKRELLHSVQGPVIRRPHGTYAVRYAGMGEIRQLEQYYRMNRARDFAGWQDAMRLQALPSINYVYADRAGHVAYYYNALLPRRAPGWDWSRYLPGDRSDLIWHDYLPWDALPKVVDPRSGMVASSNHTPFRATVGDENPRPADFDASLGIETRMTNRALRALALYGGDPKVTRDEFFAYKYDKVYGEGSDARRIVAEVLAGVPEDDPELGEARRVLAGWDFSTDAKSRGAALGVLTALPIVLAGYRETTPPDPVESFRAAVASLRQHHGRVDPPWGEVNRFRRGGIDAPISGGPDVLRAVETFELDPDGTFTARSGDCFILFVEWDRDGTLRSESIHQFGSATLDERSPHYADQSPLFLAERTKPVWLDEATLRQHLEREYRPGRPLD